ncbi:MAG: hypothetical protein ACKV2T_35765 [Kofleriaceae bacterium]
MKIAACSIAIALLGCTVKQAPPPPGYYPQPAYSNAPPPPTEYDPMAAEYGGGNTYGAAGYSNPYAPYGGGVDQTQRRFSFNGQAATPQDLQTLAQIERWYGRPAPEGEYWYDRTSGAAGQWGGPTLGFLPAGLALGGALPPNASGGGNGMLTGVFINGRELHPVDVQVLQRIYGQVYRGRFWVDAQGNAGQEGGVAFVNLIVLAKQLGRGAESYYRSDGRGNNAFVGGGCVSVSSTSGSGYDKKTYDYYSPGC